MIGLDLHVGVAGVLLASLVMSRVVAAPPTGAGDCCPVPTQTGAELTSSASGGGTASFGITWLFDTTGFPRRWNCGTWSEPLGWLHILSDLGIWSAYMAIPVVLGFFIIKRRTPLPLVTWLFIAFIASCGIGHFIEATIFWNPVYRLAGVWKMCTAIVSWATVVALIPVVPKVLKWPMLHEMNDQLKAQVRERDEAAAARALAERDLRRSNAELEQFAYVASHDLQEPLRTVASHLALVEAECGDDLTPDARLSMSYAIEGSKRMTRLINDLLEYSRVDRLGAPFRSFALSQAVDDALASLHATIEDRGARVMCGPLPMVAGDVIQITQLLQNLIGNAIKFCDKTVPEIDISADVVYGMCAVTVRDNGIGIDPSCRERIFHIFQRLHTRDEYEGTGIGLALCKRIVERHGGEISVSSSTGNGSAFTFTIPAESSNDSGVQRQAG